MGGTGTGDEDVDAREERLPDDVVGVELLTVESVVKTLPADGVDALEVDGPPFSL